MKRYFSFACLLALALSTPLRAEFTDWTVGPFSRPADAEPIIKPDPASVFDCPMKKMPIHWEGRHTFNPAAVVKDGTVYVLYRAEDESGSGIGSFTSRLGLAASADGVHFTKESKPVFYPAEDNQKGWEWYGGCEDPRLTEGPDGTYYITYSQYPRETRDSWRIGLASSKDLHNWTKYGSPFTGTKYEDNHGLEKKSAAIVNEVKNGRLVPAKINGKYWMYFGETCVNLAISDDLIHWTPVEGADGNPVQVMQTRRGFLDSSLVEIGPSPLLTSKGIIVFFNAKNGDPGNGGDPELSKDVYTGSQALFSASDPAKLISRLDHPFIKPACLGEVWPIRARHHLHRGVGFI